MDRDTAYHFDAGLFGNYLRDHHCIPNGVLHLKGKIEKVMKNPDGSIDSLVTTQDGLIKADLYIDCTGFQSLLLEPVSYTHLRAHETREERVLPLQR